MKKSGVLNWVALILVVVGAVNWGLVGLMDLDLVKLLFGEMTQAARAVYILVGLAGVYELVSALRCCAKSE